jgi:uncharacterized damage-inducible protein DinB
MGMSESAELAAKLKSEGEKFGGFFGGLAEAEWKVEVYADGAIWSIRNILAHLMTAERAFLKLFEEVRRGGPGTSEDFVIDRYNARQQEKTQAATPAELLEQYRSVRARMVEWVSKLQDLELEQVGRHPFLGKTTLREMIKMVYIHNQTHYRDIRRVLKA